mmetsp:Transcript_62899/g.172774  ORF Transcript_62899/g.172774 Transcript_62899/m.172774 type:complete len:469 (-) Transcript_62899:124-1530(-)
MLFSARAIAALLATAVPHRAPPVQSGATGAAAAEWLDAFLGDDILTEARWAAAEADREEDEEIEENEGASALTYGEFEVGCFHLLLEHAVGLSGGDSSTITFCDLGSGGGRLVLSAAAAWPFRRCVGVELLATLHEMAIGMHGAARQVADKLDRPLAPCTFERLDLTDTAAAAHLADCGIAFAFSTCFGDARFATALRHNLPAGCLVVTIDALMPNLEGGSHERLPFFHMIDAVSVPWLVGTDERAEDGGASAGHVAYFWRLETDRPQLSVDYSVLSQRPSLLVPVDGSSDDEDEAAGTAGEEDEGNDGEDLSADGPLAQRLQADMASLVPLAAARFAVLDTQTSRGRGLFVGSERIPLGMYLMDYGGELLNEPQFDARYPSGEGADYAVGIDSTQSGGQAVYIDAANPSMSNLARYMNHCDAAPNCRAATLRSPPRLMLFTTRDVEVGEELVWDYGARYWGQRPDKV